jgi:hypothetical protein
MKQFNAGIKSSKENTESIPLSGAKLKNGIIF